MTCKLTPLRLTWLLHLSQYGACPIARMPKRGGCNSNPGYPTWGPMLDAGWIDEMAPTRGSMLRNEKWIQITGQGRDILAPYTRELIKADEALDG